LWAAVLPVAVEHTQHSSHTGSHEEHGHGDSEPIIVKKVAAHERLAQEMKKSGVDCAALALGSHELEREESYYSHGFALSSWFVTNKGLIEVRGKNIDFVQVLQRN
jgi:hypothetical protein